MLNPAETLFQAFWERPLPRRSRQNQTRGGGASGWADGMGLQGQTAANAIPAMAKVETQAGRRKPGNARRQKDAGRQNFKATETSEQMKAGLFARFVVSRKPRDSRVVPKSLSGEKDKKTPNV